MCGTIIPSQCSACLLDSGTMYNKHAPQKCHITILGMIVTKESMHYDIKANLVSTYVEERCLAKSD